jgi:LmbE family N-acetylglucosaminyl deacetylase
MDKTIDRIIKDKIRCFFISPHQDDAIFSAGGLISYLASRTEVVIVNVFDGCGDVPYTLSARTFAKQCGYKKICDLSLQRHIEDREVAKTLNVSLIDLGFDDAVFRKRKVNNKFLLGVGKVVPEILHIYPIYRLNIRRGKISTQDKELMYILKKRLKEVVNKDRDIVFCPMSVGGHVDHRIVKKVCQDVFKNAFFWMDYPYVLSAVNKERLFSQKYSCFSFDPDWKFKESMIKGYKSQYYAIFKNGIKRISEMYFRFK